MGFYEVFVCKPANPKGKGERSVTKKKVRFLKYKAQQCILVWVHRGGWTPCSPSICSLP